MNKSLIYTTSKDEWYTPIDVIEYARSQMGNIDLDPATNAKLANQHNIRWFCDKERNGLTKDWFGNVWLNQPFSIKNNFIRKARQELNNGTVNKIFILLPLSPETKVWKECILGRAIIHIPNKRINFISEDGKNAKGVSFTSVLVELTREYNSTYKTFEIKG